MHVETAAWTRAALEQLDLPREGRVLDIGSSTLHYRTVEQPHIERDVLAPLRARGLELVHLDAKDAPGVDVVCDLDQADGRVAGELGEYDVVIVASVLLSLIDLGRAAEFAVRTLKPGGYLVAHSAQTGRRGFDPVDRMHRLSPDQLAGLFETHGLERVRAESVRIDDPRYYRGIVSRPSWIAVRGRWVPLPGVSEQARRWMPRLRWRQSCVLMRRP